VPIDISIRDIGGIRQESRTLPPGVTTLVGENASNRSSFLAGLMAVLGSTNGEVITPNSNVETGHVEATIDRETYTRTVTSTERPDSEESVSFAGEPLVTDADDAALLDLYAFLNGENEVRRVIEQNGDIYDVLMRPVDTEAIEAEIEALTEEIESLEDELDEVETAKRNKEQLEAKHSGKKDRIEELDSEIQELEATCSELEDAMPSENEDESTEQATELEQKLTELESKKTNTERQLRRKERRLEAAKEELEAAAIEPDTDLEELEADREALERTLDEIEGKLRTRRELRSYVNDLYTTVRELQGQDDRFDELAAVLSSQSLPDGPIPLDPGQERGDPTANLLDQQQGCYVCGSAFDADRLDAVLEQYGALRDALQEEIDSVEAEKQEVETQVEKTTQELQTLRAERETIQQAEDEIARLEPEIEQLETTIKELADEIEAVKAERSEITVDSNDEIIQQYHDTRDALRTKKQERRSVKETVDGLEAEIAELTRTIDRKETIRADLDQAREQREELRDEVERIERAVVEEFNDAMDTVVDRLGYENLERVWLERRETEVREGRRTVERTVFDLHVIRDGDAGVYEGRLEHLSESERATIGVILAVTGYVVHDVAEICPVVLLDSVEMMDSSRIASLLDFLTESVSITWIVAALLPDHMTEQVRDVAGETETFETPGEVTIK
jgi:predicted  nucleic acid-binding Zn-ribbon protein